MRLLHAVGELERWPSVGGDGPGTDREWRTLALYTDPDRQALFVREADEAYPLGSATFLDPESEQRKSRYLDYEALERALVESRAEAVWVGWGFVAEQADFVELCDRLGVVFIGPPASVMRELGDKISSKKLAEKAGVPVAPWSGGPVETLEAAHEHAERLGYPLMLKATSGGGGRGIRRLGSPADLEAAFTSARSEARLAFGDPTLFLERRVAAARHVEVQILADRHGIVWPLGVRDCTLQRRNQKILEETPSPVLTPAEDAELCDAAARLAREAGYVNAGTVEFLFDPERRQFYFMEVNARLQVEHPVTELVTGVDLVRRQLAVAAGERLPDEPPPRTGHSIEVRLNAEDPDRGFAPAPGTLELFRLPTGPGVRVDTGVEEGDAVAPEFDSMIAKVISWGPDRREALARLRRALAETTVVLRGGASNKAFLEELLRRPEVLEDGREIEDGTGADETDEDRDTGPAERVHIGWIEELVSRGEHVSHRHGAVALLHAAVEAYLAEMDVERTRLFASARRGRPEIGEGVGRRIELRHRGQGYSLEVFRCSPRQFRVKVDGATVGVELESLGRSGWRLTIGRDLGDGPRTDEREDGGHPAAPNGVRGESFHIISVQHGPDSLVEVEGVPHRISRDDGGLVRAPAPAVVVAIPVEEGDEVAPGDRLAVLEAMKMETAVLAEYPARVRKVLVRRNVQVAPETPLLRLEPTGAAGAEEHAERLRFEDRGMPGEDDTSCAPLLLDLERAMLGYDVDPVVLQRRIAEEGSLCPSSPVDDPEVLERETRVLEAFVDISSLFRRQPTDDGAEEEGVGDRRSAGEYLFTYLRDPEARGEGLPSTFLSKLERAVGHYGVTGLDPSPELEECLFRICRSHRRMPRQVRALLSLLEHRLEGAESLRPLLGEPFRELLDQMVAESRGRYPAVHDLAREVRYHYYERPVLEESHRRVAAGIETVLDRLDRRKEPKDRDTLVDELVACPQPLLRTVTRRFAKAGSVLERALLEALLRRYYRLRNLERVETIDDKKNRFAVARYRHRGERRAVLITHCVAKELARTADAVRRQLDGLAVKRDGVALELLLEDPKAPRDNGDLVGHLARSLAPFPSGLGRIAVTLVPGDGREDEPRGARYFTFEPRSPRGVEIEGENEGEAGEAPAYEERPLYRGFHPMLAERLQLWRFKAFDLERLPASDEVHLLHAVARENPRDERFFVLAEVRDLTPVRDDAGRVVQLPQFERQFHEAVAALRRTQFRRPPERRLHWNRIQLYVWPDVELDPEEIQRLVARMAPATEGLGLEKVVLRGSLRRPETGEVEDTVLEAANPSGRGVTLHFREPAEEPIPPLDEYQQRVVRLHGRGLVDPYEIVGLLAPPREGSRAELSDLPPGRFVEHDLVEHDLVEHDLVEHDLIEHDLAETSGGEADELVPVDRPPGRNRANVVVGVIRNFTAKHPEGMARVILLGDPSRGMGSLAEPECRRILAALDLAEQMGVPLEWFSVSAGARISMDSGVENMDWIARVLRKLVRFTQDGGEVNVIVHAVNVGAQPYWNAEATMLMHTRGVLIQTAQGAMVLTGKRALDYSGGVSAEDDLGIGGYERIMGPNGQAQYFAQDVGEACHILLRHYEHTYIAPGERYPRPATTRDPRDRDVCIYPHGGTFATVGEVFSDATNPGRKKAFDIRRVMRSVTDQDFEPLERWFGMEDAEVTVVWDAHLGGHAVCLLGLESRPVPRFGFVPADGPNQWTSGTLFPLASKKMARAINSASHNRPVVVLANLSGFDGSPESMRRKQLEFGAEIGRAVVNFRGPFLFCVISRYHGGAFVVFSNALNEEMEVSALEGSYASVIGGAPAAGVVFARDVKARTEQDPRVADLKAELEAAQGTERARLQTRFQELFDQVHSEKLGEVAEQFDAVHSIHRAREVGSVHRILPPERLRPYLIDGIERGMARDAAETAEE